VTALADAGLADDERDTDATVCERRPGRGQPCKRSISADEWGQPALRTQSRGEWRLLADRSAARTQRGGEVSSRRGGGKAELPAEAHSRAASELVGRRLREGHMALRWMT